MWIELVRCCVGVTVGVAAGVDVAGGDGDGAGVGDGGGEGDGFGAPLLLSELVHESWHWLSPVPKQWSWQFSSPLP
jgi:hypothetical protein